MSPEEGPLAAMGVALGGPTTGSVNEIYLNSGAVLEQVSVHATLASVL